MIIAHIKHLATLVLDYFLPASLRVRENKKILMVLVDGFLNKLHTWRTIWFNDHFIGPGIGTVASTGMFSKTFSNTTLILKLTDMNQLRRYFSDIK